MNAVVIVIAMVLAFLCGRMGGSGRSTYDGMLFLGDSPEDCHMMLTMSDEELHCTNTVMLRIVNER